MADNYIWQYIHTEKSFCAATGLSAISGTSETPYLLIDHPSSHDQNLLITHLVLGIDSSSVRGLFKIYSNPTVTSNGTEITPVNTMIKSSPASAVTKAYRSPTCSANGTFINEVIYPANSPSRGANRFYKLEPGNKILVTVQNAVSNAQTMVEVFWVEDA